jgi:uncharacterized protein YhaN
MGEMIMEEIKGMLQQVMLRLDGLEGRFDGLEGRFDGLERRMDEQFDEVKQQLNRIERNQEEDVIAILERIENKAIKHLDQHDHQIDLLNNRLLNVEAELKAIMK